MKLLYCWKQQGSSMATEIWTNAKYTWWMQINIHFWKVSAGKIIKILAPDKKSITKEWELLTKANALHCFINIQGKHIKTSKIQTAIWLKEFSVLDFNILSKNVFFHILIGIVTWSTHSKPLGQLPLGCMFRFWGSLTRQWRQIFPVWPFISIPYNC